MTLNLKSKLLKAFNVASTFYCDVRAAFKAGAMPDGERRLREAEILAGVGEVVLAPEAPGGAFMVGDALRTFAKAGHKVRAAEKQFNLI